FCSLSVRSRLGSDCALWLGIRRGHASLTVGCDHYLSKHAHGTKRESPNGFWPYALHFFRRRGERRPGVGGCSSPDDNLGPYWRAYYVRLIPASRYWLAWIISPSRRTYSPSRPK